MWQDAYSSVMHAPLSHSPGLSNALLRFISSAFIYSAAGGEKKNLGSIWVGGQFLGGQSRLVIKNVKRSNL